jgi:hypothetical protein
MAKTADSHVFSCAQCAKPFSGRKRKFCCHACRTTAANEKSRREHIWIRNPKPTCADCGVAVVLHKSGAPPRKRCDTCSVSQCAHCGETFVIGNDGGHQIRTGHKQRFCSRACGTRFNYSMPSSPVRSALDERNQQSSEAKRLRLKAQKEDRERKAIADAEARRANVAERARQSEARRKSLARDCGWCGKHFVPVRISNRPPVCCSRECGYRRDRSFSNGRQRAKAFGVPYESIDSVAVFEDDKWKCYICAEDAPRALKGTNHPLAPTLDHVVPMSKGGPHMRGNIRCAHRRCNEFKADRIGFEHLAA